MESQISPAVSPRVHGLSWIMAIVASRTHPRPRVVKARRRRLTMNSTMEDSFLYNLETSPMSAAILPHHRRPLG